VFTPVKNLTLPSRPANSQSPSIPSTSAVACSESKRSFAAVVMSFLCFAACADLFATRSFSASWPWSSARTKPRALSCCFSKKSARTA
jgi:hypothetical protein